MAAASVMDGVRHFRGNRQVLWMTGDRLYRIVIERRSILMHGARQGIYAYMHPSLSLPACQ